MRSEAEQQIESCPFCGEAVRIEPATTGGWAILHSSIFADCVLHLPIVITGVGKMDAIDMWNRRARVDEHAGA